MSGTRILVIDDEPQLHRFLKPSLQVAGYVVDRADTAGEGLHLAASRDPAVVLLDLGLPDIDGHEALRRLRAFSQVPVIVVSARHEEAEKIRALDAGADDYVEKPFGLEELLARLRACVRRGLVQEGVTAGIWRHDGVKVDLVYRRVHVDGAEVTLTPREYDLMALLVRNAGYVVTHKRLLAAVWGPAHDGDLQYLRVYIGHLRRKLGPAGGRAIATEGGIGYRLAPNQAEPIPDGSQDIL